MTVSERRENIIEMFRSANFVTITDIVNRFDISNETARRDLDYLQDQKLIQRVYGGAILRQYSGRTIQAQAPQSLNALGKVTADLVKAGESIFLGNGSTTLQVAKHLRSRSNITVITSSLANVNALAGSNVNVIVLGGQLSHNELDMSGILTSEAIGQFYCNKAIFSCGGITENLDIMDHVSYGTPLHSRFIQRSSQHILVTASHKFDAPAFAKGCSMSDIDIVVTDTNLDREYARRIRELGIELITVELDSDEFAI